MKKFYECLRKIRKDDNKFEKKKMKLSTKEQQKSLEKVKI